MESKNDLIMDCWIYFDQSKNHEAYNFLRGGIKLRTCRAENYSLLL